MNPMRLAAVVDAVRITVMRYGTTLSTADADDAKLALSYAELAIADTEAEMAGSGPADAKLKSLVAALKAGMTADAAALDEVIKVAGDLRARQADLTKASAAIDAQVNRINDKLGTVRAEQGGKTAASVQQTQQTVIFSAAGALVLGTVLAWLIGASVSGPIRSMTDRMQSLAAGELDEAIRVANRATRSAAWRGPSRCSAKMPWLFGVCRARAGAQREATEADRMRMMAELAGRFEQGMQGVITGVGGVPRRWAAVPRNWPGLPSAAAGSPKPSRPVPSRPR